MKYTISPLTPHTGAEVRGIDLNQGVDVETRTALNRAFAEHHVLAIHPTAIHRRRRGLWRTLPARQARDARAGISADLLFLERADRAGQAVRIEGMVGMEDEEALDLVAELMAHATQKKYEYRHQWHYGDFVIWDSRSVIHKANPDYDMNERRYLYRLMLKGETPV